MAGLLSITEGHVSVEGLDPMSKADKLRVILGYMPQKFGLYEDLTVMENLVLYADLRGVLDDERQTEFDRLLNFTDLTNFTSRPAGKLPVGSVAVFSVGGCAPLAPVVTIGVDPKAKFPTIL